VPYEAYSSDALRVNTPLYCLGYPSGLPLKQASGVVRVNDDAKYYFKTDLTTFQGNSGSPVFTKDTNQIVGILVSGAVDYIQDKNTGLANVIKTPNFSRDNVGECVTRIGPVLQDAKLV